jgi:putative hydrolase of the HAD superfamily
MDIDGMHTLKAVLFDGGNTVIIEIPGMDGPMVDWPGLKAVPGVDEALKFLTGRYLIGMATNASQSNQVQIFAALQRVGLDGYFSKIYCARDMGLRKPDLAYFTAILRDMGVPAQHTAMVGDIYDIDVVGAKRSGLRAIWYNPEHRLVENNQPEYDAEIDAMESLPNAIGGGFLPDIPTCQALLADQAGGPNLLAHVTAVAAAAYRMAVQLRERGESVDPLLAHRGGLLHDLDKITARKQGRVHGELSTEILAGLGFPDLGEIARRHVLSSALRHESAPATWEQKVVFYADKLAEGDSLVSVPERLQALRSRYPDYADQIQQGGPIVLQLEAELCAVLGLSPTELLNNLRSNL